MRQKQDTVSTDLFDRAGNINGDLGAVTAAGNNGGFAGNFLGGGDDGGDLIRLQRKNSPVPPAANSTGALYPASHSTCAL